MADEITRGEVADLIRAEHDRLAEIIMALTDALIGADPQIKPREMRKAAGRQLREALAANEEALAVLVGDHPAAPAFPRRGRCERRS